MRPRLALIRFMVPMTVAGAPIRPTTFSVALEAEIVLVPPLARPPFTCMAQSFSRRLPVATPRPNCWASVTAPAVTVPPSTLKFPTVEKVARELLEAMAPTKRFWTTNELLALVPMVKEPPAALVPEPPVLK